jgi:hypothetical protein
MPFYLGPPPQNPLTRLLTAIIALVVMAGAFMLGLVALAVVVGLALAIGAAAWLRVWWAGRHASGPVRSAGPGTGGEVIETEYTVVSRKRDS